MNWKKSATPIQFLQFIGISLFVHILILIGMNQVNLWETSKALYKTAQVDLDAYITPHSNASRTIKVENPTRFTIEKNPENSIVAVFPPLKPNGNFEIDIISTTGEPFALLFDDTHSPFSLTKQGAVVGQNINKDRDGYTSNRAYALFTFTHDDYKKSESAYILNLRLTVAYRTKGMQSNSYMLIGSINDLTQYMQQRLMIASVLFGGYLLLLLVSIIIFLQFKSAHMLVTICMSLAMTTRFILLGEFPFLGSLQMFPSQYVFIVDYFLAVVIFLLAQILAKSLFSFTMPNKVIPLYSILFIGVEMFGILKSHLFITLAMHLLGMIATIYMASSERSEYHQYGLLIVVAYSIFSASVANQILLYLGLVNRGISIFMLLSNQFSAMIYIGSLHFAIIRTNSLRLRALEQKQQTFERSILLQGISHDLKLPLSVIKLNTQIRSTYHLNEEEIRQLDDSVLQATSELEEMTENINVYLHAVSNTQESGSCMVRECLKEITSRYEYFGAERNIILETHYTEHECEIPISSLQFDRMISNLLDNAFKYIEGSGKVILRYTLGKSIMISVEDTGIGIEEDALNLILNPFYRADASRNTKGSGLGLSVVKAVADNLGATLHVESILGKGTIVTLGIPSH